jgi:hypothetical protein
LIVSSRPDDTDDAPPFEDDEMFTQRDRFQERRRQGVSEFVRRAIENTVGSMQTTGTLSKEALAYLLQQGDRGKKELVRIVANEVGQFLRGIDLSGEVVKVLSSVQLEVNASVRFKPVTDKTVKPVVEASVNVQNAANVPPPATPTESAPPAESKDDGPKPASSGE